MRRLDLWFLILATASLLTGVGMGIWMGVVHDFQFAPVHAHLNLLGWASLALFGLTYRAYPAMKESRLASVHFALAAVGAIMFPIGIALSVAGVTIALAILGSFVWLAGVIAFFVGLLRLVAAPSVGRAPFALPAE